MSDHLSTVINQLTLETYQTLAGPDWPSFDDIKANKNIPDFVSDELEEMFFPKYVEFYITNVCNLSCSDCHSFNNFNFKGHHEFDINVYQPWAEKFNLDAYSLLGGEPLLHPNLTSWVEGTRKLWPTAWAKLDSNGTYIKKVKGLHELLVNNKYFLCINVHESKDWDQIQKDITRAFGQCNVIEHSDPRIRYNGMFDNKDGHRVTGGTWLISSKGLPIHLRPSWEFQQTIASSTNWQKLSTKDSIYTGNTKSAHDLCQSNVCHTMFEGKIYKCATMATIGKFLEQKQLRWPDQTLYEYQPLTLDNFSMSEYRKLRNEIPQCKFCPTATNKVVTLTNLKKKRDNF
jgi:hypothetical protein